MGSSRLRRGLKSIFGRRGRTLAANIAFCNSSFDFADGAIGISSYPRSGNTWVRYLLSHLLVRTAVGAGNFGSVKEVLHPDFIIPDLDANLFSQVRIKEKLGLDVEALIYKSHSSFDALSEYSRVFASAKHIIVFRNPADAFVSYYYFHMRHPSLAQRVDDIDRFALGQISDWAHFYSSYVSEACKGDRKLFICYEDLLASCTAELAKIADFTRLPLDSSSAALVDASEKCAFESLRKSQPSLLGDSPYRAPFFRQGKAGQSLKELKLSTVQEIDRKCRELYMLMKSW